MITNAKFRAQKSALTRAVNSGDPHKVIEACKKAVREWGNDAWPDDWHRWNIALGDATGNAWGTRVALDDLEV